MCDSSSGVRSAADAGLVNGGQLLLLQHFARHVADGDDQVLRSLAILDDRRGMHLEETVVGGAHVELLRRGGDGGVEGTEVGAEISGLPKTV